MSKFVLSCEQWHFLLGWVDKIREEPEEGGVVDPRVQMNRVFIMQLAGKLQVRILRLGNGCRLKASFYQQSFIRTMRAEL